jgi:hypothetical protein
LHPKFLIRRLNYFHRLDCTVKKAHQARASML